MNAAVYEHLIKVAGQRRLVTYNDLAKIADLDVAYLPDHDQLTRILEEIAEHEVSQGRPLLVVVVIREDIQMPAKGFFKWARRRRLQKGKDFEFFAEELERVYRAWATPTGTSG